MKLLCIFPLVLSSLFGQIEPNHKYEVDLDTRKIEETAWTFIDEFTYEVKVVNGTKTLFWYVEDCAYPPFWEALGGEFKGYCTKVDESATEIYSEVLTVFCGFYNQYPNGDDKYGPFFRLRSAATVPAGLTTVQPVAPPNPRMVFLDGLTYNILAVDMATFNTVGLVTLPPQATAFGIRPVATATANEVWTAHAGTVNEISICDLAAQSVLATIPIPSPVESNNVPEGIVFTPDGATALEALHYYTPDSSGNNGALLVFDAVNRTVTSTMLVKDRPTALLMAPDGLTAYILDDEGNITYYDVLSGTADLTVSTYPPGMAGGYPGASANVFIHPDGTRLFWNINYLLEVFDLTTRTITTFSSGLSSSSAPTFSMSQDGGRVYFSDNQGDVVIMDTQYGNILATESDPGVGTAVFGGPPIAP